MNDAKDKQVFKESLKGLKTAKDRFGTPIIEGEIIAYATVQWKSPIMKVAKILEVKRKEGTKNVSQGGAWVTVPDQKVTLRVQGATKSSWDENGKWELQQASTLKKIENVIILTNPVQEVVDLFKDV
jgi:hypothetical protein